MDFSAILRGTVAKTVNWERLRCVGRWWVAVVGGVLLAVLGFLLFYRLGGLASAAPPLALTGAQLQLVQGEGEPTPSGLLIRRVGAQGRALAQASTRIAPAAIYAQVAWRLDGVTPDQDVQLVWATLADPQTVHSRSLPRHADGVLDLSMEPRWRGRILAIGLSVPGPLAQPVRIEQLELRPVMPSLAMLGRELAADWGAFENWSQRSINFAANAPLNALFPPVSMALLALALGAVLYALLEPPRRTPGALWPYVGLFLLAWLILDGRWQWTLTQRLEQTAADFAGKSAAQRWQVLDEALYPFLQQVQHHLPPSPVRLYVISADPTGFAAGRARYHLLPHNSHVGFVRLPPPKAVRVGDYLLLLAPLDAVRYEPARQSLEQASVRLPVELLYRATLGALFRVRDANLQEH